MHLRLSCQLTAHSTGEDNLISFGSSSGGTGAHSSGIDSKLSAAGSAAAAAPHTLQQPHVPGEEQLVSEMDQLLLAAQPSRGTSAAGAAAGAGPAAP